MVLTLILLALFTNLLNAGQISPNALKLLNSFTRNCELIYIDENAGYGLKATKNINYGDPIMVIPPTYILSTFEKYPWSVKFKSYPSTFRLTIRLLYEKFVNKENSNRKLLIDSYPENFYTAFTFTQEQKSRFEDYFGSEVLFSMPINCTKDYDQFIQIADSDVRKCKDCINQSNFFWACQAVLTRAYTHYKHDYYILTQGRVLGNEQNEVGSALIFGVDMFNHYPLPELKNKGNFHGLNFIGDPAHILVKSDRTFIPGEEVFMTYGPKSNLELFINHGFIIKNNPDDSGVIWIPSNGNDCESYSDLFKVCQFGISSGELNVDIVNYLFFKLTGSQIRIKSVFDLLKKSDEEIFKTQNLIAVFRTYKNVIASYSLNRCKGKIKTGKDLENIDILERLCQENHRLFMSHIVRLDHFLASLFYNELIKL